MTEGFFSSQGWKRLKRSIAEAEEKFYAAHPTQKRLADEPRFVTVDADSEFGLPTQGAPPLAWERCPQGGVHKDGLTVLLGVLNDEVIDSAMNAKPKPEDMDALFGYDLWRYGSAFSQEHSGRKSRTVPFEMPHQSGSRRRKQQQGVLTQKKKRSWCSIETRVGVSIEKRVREVLERFGLVGRDHVADLMSYLRSVKGAPRQSYHSDFKKHRLFDSKLMHEGSLPYPVSVLLALQDGATLTLRDGTTVPVPKGAACVFRGDLIHAGSEWYREQENWRMHIYYGVNRTDIRYGTCMVPRSGAKRQGGKMTTVIEPRLVDTSFGWCA